MTDRKEAEALIAAYEALVARAVSILNAEGPPWGYVSNVEWARISIKDDMVIIRHPEASYDCSSIETDTEKFPAALLFMSDEELREWKRVAKAAYDQEQRDLAQRRIQEKEMQEFAAYQILKQRFEP